MTFLQPNEYDISYFDGKLGSYKHNAGYTVYQRWFRINNDFVPYDQSTGEYWKDLALRFKLDYSLQNKKVLEIGSAKGYIVQAMRELGINAYGIDVSQYAFDCADKEVKPYLRVADIRTALSEYSSNEFAYLFSRNTLCCFIDEEIIAMIIQMNRIAVQQVHWIMETGNNQYYNLKRIQILIDQFSWKKGTIFTKNNLGQIYKK